MFESGHQRTAIDYLNSTVPIVFDDFKNAMANRIEGLDYQQNWYHLVAFILFVMRLKHSHIDAKTSELIEEAVEHYVSNQSAPFSYLNYFGAPEFKGFVQNYEPDFMITNINALMHNYILAWNESIGNNAPVAASICFAKYLSTDGDTRHLTLVFDYIYDRLGAPGGFPIFHLK